MIQRKIKVFISSRCDGQYGVARKAIALLLEETNLATTYVFESEPGSSMPLVDGYLFELDESDVVIFLINNIDGVPDGVLKEHNRARALNKKSIYIFCDEGNGKVTGLQSELIQSQIVKFCPIHSFAEITQVAYISLLSDIVNLYRYSGRDQITNSEQPTETEVKRSETEGNSKTENEQSPSVVFHTAQERIPIVSENTIDFRALPKGFEHTKRLIETALSLPAYEPLPEAVPMDRLLASSLECIIGISNANLSLCDEITDQLKVMYEPHIFSVIAKRWGAIRKYFAGNIQACVDELTEVYDIIKDDESIPDWMLADVLIDLRNQNALLDNINDQFMFSSSAAQKLLDERRMPAYYPVIDRLAGSVSEKSLQEVIKHKTKSPYTIFFGTNLNMICESITSAYIVAALHGSLTHMLLTRNRIIDALTAFCTIFSDHSLYLQLLKMLVLTASKKEYETFDRAYSPGSNFLNADDADALWIIACSPTIPHSRFKARLLAWSKMCNFFSDEQFLIISDDMVVEIRNWITNENKIVHLGASIYDALKLVSVRLDANTIAELLILSIDNRIPQYMDNIHEVVSNLRFSDLNEQIIKKLVNRLCIQAHDENTRSSFHWLPSAMLDIRLNCHVVAHELDSTVEECFPEYFTTDYQLETTDDTSIILQHLERYLRVIHTQNEEQGKNGTIHGYAGDAHQTVTNILVKNQFILTKELAIAVFSAAKETLLAPKQTVQAKIGAIGMIEQIIVNCANLDLQFIDDVNELVDNPIVSQASASHFGGELSENPLALNILLLRQYVDKSTTANILERILFTDRTQKRDILSILASFHAYIYAKGFDSLPPVLVGAIIQFASEMSTSEERDIRIGAVRILGLASETDYALTCLHRLSTLMDVETESVKIRILQNIGAYRKHYQDVYDYIIQKGVTDNSFSVRMIANKVLKNS